MLAASALMPVNIKAGKVRKVPPPAKAFWMPAQTATRKRMTSAAMASAVAQGPCRGKLSGVGGLVPARGNQLGAAHRLTQITRRLAPAIIRLLFRCLVPVLGATPRH